MLSCTGPGIMGLLNAARIQPVMTSVPDTGREKAWWGERFLAQMLLTHLGCRVVPALRGEGTDNQTYSLPRRLEAEWQGVSRVGLSRGLAPGLLTATGPCVPHTVLSLI